MVARRDLGMVARRDLVEKHLRDGTHSNPVAPQMGLEPSVFQLKLHNLSQGLMKLRFFMSRQRRNSVRGKGKK